jgi:hypothetical protein
VSDPSVAAQDPERAIVKSAVGMLFPADQSVAPRDVKVAVRDVEVGKLLAEERESIFAMFFERIGRDHYEIGSRFKNLRVILLQRSSDAGGSVRVISVAILSRENEFLVSRGQLMQRKPAIRCFDEKLGSFDSDSKRFRFGDHIAAPRHPLSV